MENSLEASSNKDGSRFQVVLADHYAHDFDVWNL